MPDVNEAPLACIADVPPGQAARIQTVVWIRTADHGHRNHHLALDQHQLQPVVGRSLESETVARRDKLGRTIVVFRRRDELPYQRTGLARLGELGVADLAARQVLKQVQFELRDCGR